MGFIQLVTPNLKPILIQYINGVRTTIHNWSGWCLLFTQSSFNAGWAGFSAWDSWSNRLQYKHSDRNIPSGVFVPIWFDGYDSGLRLGHSAIYKDGRVYSTPYFAAGYYIVLGSIEEVERIYNMSYVGWSEDIGGIKVIEEISMEASKEKCDLLTFQLLWNMAFNAQPSEADIKHHMSLGYTVEDMARALKESEQYKQRAAAVDHYFNDKSTASDSIAVDTLKQMKLLIDKAIVNR